ncbi:MAG: glycosyltransferase, partial [Desulfovibrio sp.]|nr:glycosyltransferase [Desulfovibrio sp.]
MRSFESLYPLTADLRPITLLSFGCEGGAGKAALQLAEGLSAAGARVRFVTLQRGKAAHEWITEISDNGRSLFAKSRISLGIALSRGYPKRPHGYEYFSTVKGVVDLSVVDAVKKAALIHLHWTEGLAGWPGSGGALAGKPLVWTLHDMNPFTGGCHYTAGCEKYTAAGCVNCPQLGPSLNGKDLAAENFAAKSEGYALLNLTAVTPGRWLGECVRASRLLGSFPREVIPNGIDTDVFSPLPRDEARAVFGLPPGRRMVLFSANDVNRRNKGYQVLLAALDRLLPRWTDGPPPLLLILGTPPQEKPPGYECFLPGFIEDKAKLAAAYAAADVFVSPSFQEVFGLATAEAQA